MLRKWGVLGVLMLALPLAALGQTTGKLAGQVLDAETGDPLPGASVVLAGTQIGTISDIDGNYFILGVPVGSFDVQASFVGYQTATVSGVEINAGYTREINFTLSPGVELDEIVVEYERPLIQKDAVGASKVITGETIANLPVRGIGAVTALQAGVVNKEGTGALNIRGGRGEEVVFFVDGVKVIGLSNVPQNAIQEQEMLIGTIPARFGDAQSGIVSITTQSGSSDRFFGSLEFVTSEALDPYGYNLGSFSLGGPLGSDKLSFFVAGEATWQDDDNPYAVEIPEIATDALYQDIRQNPQVMSALDADGNQVWITVPADIFGGEEPVSATGLADELEERGLVGGETGVSLQSSALSFRHVTLSDDSFKMVDSKASPSTNYRVNGSLTYQPTSSITVKGGGSFGTDTDETFSYTRSLFNRDRFYETERQTWRAFGLWRQRLGDATFYELRADYTDDRFYQHPGEFSNDVRETLFYGDVDGLNADGSQSAFSDTYADARRYWTYDGDADQYVPLYSDLQRPGSNVYSLFSVAGSGLQLYDKFHTTQVRVSGNVTTQVGLHQIEFGGEFERRTARRYQLFQNSGSSLLYAQLFNDGDVELGEGVDSYEDLPFGQVTSGINTGLWYGYDFLGLEEVDDDDLVGQANGECSNLGDGPACNVAPWQPVYYAGYIQDKIEFRDLVLNVGLRVDVFDSNTLTLRDPYALVPIVRAGDVGVDIAGIGDDFAVYFADGSVEKGIIGFRDLDGRFYDATGERVTDALEITTPETGPQGRPVRDSEAAFTTLFEDYEPQVTFMPRIGVSFPITNQALFFASYNVLTQRPTEQSFVPAQTYISVSANDRFANPSLKPEVTKQYEIGFRQRVGDRAAFQISGFYRSQDNKIQVRQLNRGFPVAYGSFYNVDFTTTRGASFEFDLRRTNGVALTANYTLSIAQGTGSDSSTQGTIAWRGTFFPDFIAPTSFDQRHTVNVNADYRLGEGEGPKIGGTSVLENMGFNVVGVLGSGFPYTRIEPPNENILVATNTTVSGSVNDTYTPWTANVDLRVDRRFEFGSRASVTAFVWVQNLLGLENTLGVFRATGLPDDDGFLDREAGRTQVAAATSPESYEFFYRSYLENPGGAPVINFAGPRAYGLGRRVRLGLRLSF